MVEVSQEKIELDSSVRQLFQNVGMSIQTSEFCLHDDHSLGRLKRSDKFGDGIHLFAKREDGNYAHLMCYIDQSLIATEPNQIFLTAYNRPNIEWGGQYSYAMKHGWYSSDHKSLAKIMQSLID